jgi:hypothetical protein
MKHTKKSIKKLKDYDLQTLEHDNQVDLIDDLTSSDYLHNVYNWCNEELLKRNLEKLPRLNDFN